MAKKTKFPCLQEFPWQDKETNRKRERFDSSSDIQWFFFEWRRRREEKRDRFSFVGEQSEEGEKTKTVFPTDPRRPRVRGASQERAVFETAFLFIAFLSYFSSLDVSNLRPWMRGDVYQRNASRYVADMQPSGDPPILHHQVIDMIHVLDDKQGLSEPLGLFYDTIHSNMAVVRDCKLKLITLGCGALICHVSKRGQVGPKTNGFKKFKP
uniref:Uncharacterized protein n=1 Tax=Nelumbo nucifera TaxID=4432 RepID=A0A822XT34_NELNU|nr:TPA_asm: hypothetical protein HUJ06_025023 [Nelumbo nucifera]